MQKFSLRCSITVATAIIASVITFGAPLPALAHCPLCTLGAGAAAITAKFFGAGTATVGVFIGAFAIALGSWTNMLIRKRFIHYQREALEVLSFLTTVIPLKALLHQDIPIPVFIWGNYGSLFNSTYTLDVFIVSAVVGGLIMLFSRKLSIMASNVLNGNKIPYQGMILTFIGTALAAVILEVIL